MYSPDTFRDCVISQIDLLSEGKALEAFDQFFSDNVTLYDNGTLIASNAHDGRALQAKTLRSASDIKGSIPDLTIADDTEICVFRDHSSYAGKGKDRHQTNRLVWQKWRDGKVIQQQTFDGTKMETLIEGGILKSPDNLGRRRG
ncbi:hypothetical protein [Flavimaricola marinus]|uniref:SnoaL-like domain protein n=1 Tax=Flavimaricola marinus TaxID=1819565 RepID=A0A238LBB1_9RHOB|nr:hypothetical protein [Flavimaricola marinus]SMY06695.1 hypothetical protein LOM8899_00823 [Flavimaricola marinus]